MTNVLKQIRIDRGYTQEDMAKKLGYKDKSGYNHLENGNVKLTIEKVIKIAEILNVNPSIFFNKQVQETSTDKKDQTA